MTIRPVPGERLAGLTDDGSGLTGAQAEERRSRFGANDVIVARPRTWRDLVRDTARDPMIWFLVGVSILLAALGSYTESATLAVALLPLIGMDTYLHRRTQASTQGLATRVAATARVRRDGALVTLPARDLVPGDWVEIAPNELFPADGLIVSGAELQVDESSLTGEAHPARKHALPGPPPPSADTSHWGMAGTRLLTGTAVLRVVQTGGETLYGEIARSAQVVNQAATPLQKAVRRLLAIMIVAATIMCLALAAIRQAQGHGWLDPFLSAITLAVAALPEEFPVVFTFFLGVGVYRLARRQALVRHAVAVENIGRVSCICSDKTGTLTEGTLVLAHRSPAPGCSEERLLHQAALASRADSGDPLDRALIDAAPDVAMSQRVAVFPFTEARRRESAIVRQPDGALLAVVKGAPETIFALCRDGADELAAWHEKAEALAAAGHKVIALASKPVAADAATDGEPDGGFTLSGLLALEDPIRPGVPEAIAACQQAGIRVIMVTGDHPATAGAIARDIGLGRGQPVVVSADALDRDGRGPTGESLRHVDAVARAAPAQKLRLVVALRAAGEIVAVTGDGINDVPALQAADIGIAMGERGTQSAREVAAVVLLDDNFRTIVGAIAEGRQLFRNLQLAFAYLLMIHIPLVLSAAIVPLADNPLLYMPIHIVWLELIVHPTALLVFQELPGSERLMPVQRRRSAQFFGWRGWVLIGFTGLLQAAIISLGFQYALGAFNDVEHARALALGALIGGSAAITAGLSFMRGLSAWLVIGGTLASLVVMVQVPAVAELVHLRPLHGLDWAAVAGASVVFGLLAVAVRAVLLWRPRVEELRG